MDLFDLLVLFLLAFETYDLCSRPSRGKWEVVLSSLEGVMIASVFAFILVRMLVGF